MALLGAEYDSSDSDRGSSSQMNFKKTTAKSVVAAPEVSLDVWSHKFLVAGPKANSEQDPMRLQTMLAKSTDTSLTYNIPYADLARPAQGPANPFKTTEGNALKRKNVITGYAEEAAISDATFTNQHRTFQSRGFAREPNANGNFVGDLAAVQQYEGRDVVQMRPAAREARKRQKKGDASIVDGEGSYRGPWARFEERDQYEDVADSLNERQHGEDGTQEELASDEEYVEEAIVPERHQPMNKAGTDYQDDRSTETSDFLGTAIVDYLGRSYMHAPTDTDFDLRKSPEKTYIPKKLIHTWKYGSKPVNRLAFLPQTSHLLLGCSADATIKIFDVYRDRELLRTYNGHNKSVSDVTFNGDGDRFLSASYDRFMKL